MWIPDITLPDAGKCYTLNTSMAIEEDFVMGMGMAVLQTESRMDTQ